MEYINTVNVKCGVYNIYAADVHVKMTEILVHGATVTQYLSEQQWLQTNRNNTGNVL